MFFRKLLTVQYIFLLYMLSGIIYDVMVGIYDPLHLHGWLLFSLVALPVVLGVSLLSAGLDHYC